MPTITLGTLRTAIGDRLDNAALYTQQEIVDEVNDSLRTLNLYVGFNQTTVQVPGFSVIDQYLYSTPAGILFPLQVYFNGRELQKRSLRRMSHERREWLRETSADTFPVQNWVPLGISTFAIHPADAAGGQDIQVMGIAAITPLVADGDTVTLNDEFVDAVEELAAHVLQIKEGGKIFADASRLYTNFLKKMKIHKRWRSLAMPRYFVKLQTERVAEEVGVA